MKWVEIKVVFDHVDKDLAVDLISDAFYDFGLQGVVVEDPRIGPEEGWPQEAAGRPDQYAVSGYLPADGRIENRCRVLEEKLMHLKEKIGLGYRMSYQELDEEDWAHSWKEFFWPQKIGRNMVVKPTWRDYRSASGEIVIELDPGMAFGTGTHPTTTMCVTMIETYLEKGDSFLDIGTGSGILLIAAAKLGAGEVCGVDNDRTAVEIAVGNLHRNGLEPHRMHVICGDLVKEVRQMYDMVAANILSHVILNLLKDIRRVLKPDGVFICSGIADRNEKQITTSMRHIGFEVIEISTKDEWVAIAGRLRAEGKEHWTRGAC